MLEHCNFLYPEKKKLQMSSKNALLWGNPVSVPSIPSYYLFIYFFSTIKITQALHYTNTEGHTELGVIEGTETGFSPE